MLERRPSLSIRAVPAPGGPGRLTGYAAVFDAASEDLGGFIEYVRPGAFRRSLGGSSDSGVRDPLALLHHDPKVVLGRRSAGTLRLDEDAKGLAFEIDLPDTTAARDLAVSVERGDVRGASFAFTVPAGGDKWNVTGEQVIRELLDVDLHEITVTATPAYPDTEVAKRALASLIVRPRLAVARRYMETL